MYCVLDLRNPTARSSNSVIDEMKLRVTMVQLAVKFCDLRNVRMRNRASCTDRSGRRSCERRSPRTVRATSAASLKRPTGKACPPLPRLQFDSRFESPYNRAINRARKGSFSFCCTSFCCL